MISHLSQIFQHGNDIHKPRLVIAIDEAHPLKESQKHFQPAHILCRAISRYSLYHPTASVWVVFASTTSKVADFSAPESIRVFSPKCSPCFVCSLSYQTRPRVFQRVEHYSFHHMCHLDGIRILYLYGHTLSIWQQNLAISFPSAAHCE